MSTSAIIMMAVAIAIVWGGLAAIILWIWRHPEQPDDEPGAG